MEWSTCSQLCLRPLLRTAARQFQKAVPGCRLYIDSEDFDRQGRPRGRLCVWDRRTDKALGHIFFQAEGDPPLDLSEVRLEPFPGKTGHPLWEQIGAEAKKRWKGFLKEKRGLKPLFSRQVPVRLEMPDSNCEGNR